MEKNHLPCVTMAENKTRYFFLYWFPVIVYCLLIYLQSSQPSPESIPDIPYLDKILHVGAYGLLGALLLRAFRRQNHRNNLKLMILCMVLSSLYGVSDEIHQYFVPYRHAELMDVFSDILGSILGVLFYQKMITPAGTVPSRYRI